MLQEAVMECIQEPSHKLQSYWKETISKEILIKLGWKLSFKTYLSRKFIEFRKSKPSNLLIQIMLHFSALIVVNVYAPPFSPFSSFYLADGVSCGEIQQWLLRLKPCTSHTLPEYLAGRTDHHRWYRRTLTPVEEIPSLWRSWYYCRSDGIKA